MEVEEAVIIDDLNAVDRTLVTLELLQELFCSDLSGYSLRVAGSMIVTHEIARLTGKSVEPIGAIEWAERKLEELGRQ